MTFFQKSSNCGRIINSAVFCTLVSLVCKIGPLIVFILCISMNEFISFFLLFPLLSLLNRLQILTIGG